MSFISAELNGGYIVVVLPLVLDVFACFLLMLVLIYFPLLRKNVGRIFVGSPCGLCVALVPDQHLNELTDFNEIWYGCYCIDVHFTSYVVKAISIHFLLTSQTYIMYLFIGLHCSK